MSNDLCLKIGIAMASVLALSWPSAYLASRMQMGSGNRSVLDHWTDARRHVVRDAGPCASPEPDAKAFRMGINPDYPPFSRKNLP
ncbi:MAG: hypothetical protein HQM02_07485 [Magnetococcales bacterium]|nr:hypothetical protein [Magnetococcales bacterium]